MKRKHILSTVLWILLFSTIAHSQDDKHIDPASDVHKHTLSIGKHVSTSFTIEQAKTKFAAGNKLLTICDNKVTDSQDVACQVTLEPGATMGSFGTAGDGLDIINTQAELDQVINDTSFFIKVVTDIPGDGNPICSTTGSLLACAKGNSIVIVSGLDAGSLLDDMKWGEVLVHEFGHTRGLPHRDSPGKPIMATSTLGNNEVNNAETAKYHVGGTVVKKNRPTELLLVVDDTGSMGEEIDGVKNSIITALTTVFSAASCENVFQLVHFKDAPTIKSPTTDLNAIKNQVSALSASGGGDCPEGSIEAIEAVKEKVKDSSVVVLYTDASPHPGTNIVGITEELKKRGVTISVMLSGDCLASPFRTSTPDEGPSIPYSDNKDAEFVKAASFTTASLSPNPGAIEAYSYMASETGGAFAFVPEINSGDPNSIKRFENIALNLLTGGFGPAITFIDPGKAPVGSTLFLKVSASKTHFNPSSTVTFSDPGITLSFTNALSATELELKVSIGAGVPLGFKDIVVNTTLEDGSVEVAKGIGLLEIVPTPTAPTILSILPNSGKPGEEFWVTINAINTNFDGTSVVDLGSGITVLAAEHANKEELLAKIQIAGDAATGYRSVVVTTGAEVATENVVGPFLVVSRACTDPDISAGPDQQVYYGYPPAACATLAVTGGTGELTYLWSTGDTTASIKVCPVKTTMYTVLVTQGSCSKLDTVVVNVADVRCGKNLDKVMVCHKGGKNALCIGVDGVKEHLAHGDKLGACFTTRGARSADAPAVAMHGLVVKASPNPSLGQFNLFVGSNNSNEKITIMVTDILGRKVEVRNNVVANSNVTIGKGYLPGAYIVELRQGNQRTTIKLFKATQ